MRVGVNLLNFGPGVSPDALAGWTQLAETLGYHFVMISDHVAMTPDVVARYPAPFYDPFVTLGWLARATRRVELGTTVVILPYRHPLLTARLGANVDRLSGGEAADHQVDRQRGRQRAPAPAERLRQHRQEDAVSGQRRRDPVGDDEEREDDQPPPAGRTHPDS